jgi:hypothetical protein
MIISHWQLRFKDFKLGPLCFRKKNVGAIHHGNKFYSSVKISHKIDYLNMFLYLNEILQYL